MKTPVKTIEVLDIPFAQITQADALDVLENFLRQTRNHVIVTPNPEGVMQARRNPAFAEALRSADLSLADGTGIVLASRAKGRPLPERVRGMDTTFALFERLNARLSAGRKPDAEIISDATGEGFSVYFLGGAPGIAERAGANMAAKFSALKVAGCHHGFFSPESNEESQILAEINAAAPDILLVCMGMPRAELWAARNRNINARLTLCVGGTIDIMAGTINPAPAFMRKIGLEWLWRLIRQPRRAARMLDIPRFIAAVIFGRDSESS